MRAATGILPWDIITGTMLAGSPGKPGMGELRA